MVVEYEEIKHGAFSIYKVPVVLDNKKEIRQGIDDLVDVFRPGIKDRLGLLQSFKDSGIKHNLMPGPGVQIHLTHSDNKNIRDLQSIFNTTVLNFHNTKFNRAGSGTYGLSWVFVGYPDNLETNYHDHIKMSVYEPHMVNTWTWTYYLELPDNCTGDEGKIFFSHNSEDENALKFFPEKDTLYIFPGSLMHRPEISPNSTKPRITLAGNVLIQFKDKVLV